MKINASATLIGVDGVAIAISDKDKTPAELRTTVVQALLGVYQDEQINGNDKLLRFKLAEKIQVGGVVDLTVEEVVLVKLLVGKMYGPGIVGPVYNALENSPQESADKAAA